MEKFILKASKTDPGQKLPGMTIWVFAGRTIFYCNNVYFSGVSNGSDTSRYKA